MANRSLTPSLSRPRKVSASARVYLYRFFFFLALCAACADSHARARGRGGPVDVGTLLDARAKQDAFVDRLDATADAETIERDAHTERDASPEKRDTGNDASSCEVVSWYLDGDDDGYGAAGSATLSCDAPAGYVSNNADCDDSCATCNPVGTEVCDGANDEDCDGVVDEACACTSGETQSCGIDTGACMVGTQTCSGGSWGVCAGSISPTTEMCNNRDDDCDGITDDSPADTSCSLANATSSCTRGTCAIARCVGDYGDCDLTASNGCETNLLSSRDHCGTCTTVCASESCERGECRSSTGAFSGFAKISAAFYTSRTCAVSASGRVYCWGNNDYGRLGDGTSIGRYAPTLVADLEDIADVTVGAHTSCALKVGGALYCWGSLVGDGTTTDRRTPTLVSGAPSGIVGTSIGGDSACVWTSAGNAYCWGENRSGGLGDGTTVDRTIPTRVALDDVLQVSVGGGGYPHTCARVDGEASAENVLCWGSNAYGQLGNGTTVNSLTAVTVAGITDAVHVAAGVGFSCALLESGSVKCWGSNYGGYLGDGTTSDRASPATVSGVTDAVELVSGGLHTCIRDRSSAMKCWGLNAEGELGDGTISTRTRAVSVVSSSFVVSPTQITVGGRHTCALNSDGSAACWGHNSDGELGRGVFGGRSSTPVAVVTGGL